MSQNSPFNENFYRISQKLNGFNSLRISSNKKEKSSLNNEINRITQKINLAKKNFQTKSDLLQNEINLINKTIGEERNIENNYSDIYFKEITNLDNKITNSLDFEIKETRDNNFKLQKLIDENVLNLRKEMLNENKIKNDSIKLINIKIQTEIPNLFQLIDKETKMRVLKDNILLQTKLDEINDLSDKIYKNNQSRETKESLINESLNDLLSKSLNEIDFEKKQRITNEESILKLLETACINLESL